MGKKFCLVPEQRKNKFQAMRIFAAFHTLLSALRTFHQTTTRSADKMHLLYNILICVFALATIGQGAPKGKAASKDVRIPRETPEYLCAHVYKGFYSRYYLIGTEWPVHENLVFEGARKTPGCHLTNWRWQEATNPETNGVNFNCTVSQVEESGCFSVGIGC
jgi:hypothetical protein